MNINKYLASKDYYLSKLNEYYTNMHLTDEKKTELIDKIYKKINKLIYYINKKIFFTKNKYEKELTLYINYINNYTYAYKNHNNIIHFNFNKFFIKEQKIIHNIFFKYIYDEFKQYTTNLTNIDILNIIEYTAKQDKFNINEIINNIKNKDKIKYNDNYIPPHNIIIESIPVISKNTNFIYEIRKKFANNNNETLYIFEDIYEKHSTNHKGKNKENDYIRKYNFLGKNRKALSAGISTIYESGNPVSIEIINNNISEIKELIIKHRYKKIMFLRENDKEQILFNSKHHSTEYKKYIADKLFELKDCLFKYDKELIRRNANVIKEKISTPSSQKYNSDIDNKVTNPDVKEEIPKLSTPYYLLPIPIKNKITSLKKIPSSPKKVPLLQTPNPIVTSPKKTHSSSKKFPLPQTPNPIVISPKKTHSSSKKFPLPQTPNPIVISPIKTPSSPKKTPSSPKKTNKFHRSETEFKKPLVITSNKLIKKKSQEKKITIIPSVYLKNNKLGDFSWEIKYNTRGKDTLYIFNDNHLDHKTTKPGKGNATIRIYNKYSNYQLVRSAGISTGWKPGFPFKIKDKLKWKGIIDKEFKEIKQLLETGKYNNLVFSVASTKEGDIIKTEDNNYILGTDIFANSIDDELLKYIPKKINKDLKTVMVDNNKIIINNLLQNITYFNNNSYSLNINKYSFDNIIPNYLYYYNDKKKNISFFVNLIDNNTGIYKDDINRRRHIKYYNILKYINDKFVNNIHIPLLYDSIELKNVKLYFSQYFNDNLFNFIDKQDKIQIFHVDIIINMIQQLLMATISYHTKTGLINTNINNKNIFYSFDEIIENNTYICYKLYDKLYYINYNGYIWHLTDFSESIELPTDFNILVNKKYDSYHMYCEFKVVIEIIRNKFYKKNSRLDNYIDSISSIINDFKYNYVQTLSSKPKIQEFDKILFHSLFNKMNILKTLPTNSRNKIYNNTEYEIATFEQYGIY